MPRDLARVSGKVQQSGLAEISSIKDLIHQIPLELQTIY